MISINDVGTGQSLVDEVRDFFAPEGALSELEYFEYRAEQQEMAVNVASALMDAEPLVVEAGTGVGKSLAYLLPSALLARREKRKAVISTHTINLQEQLIQKDIPLLQGVLGEDIKAVLLKGRRNYICPTRLRRALDAGGDLFTSSDQDDLRALEEWCKTTSDGSLSDINFEVPNRVWAQVCSEPHICTVKSCGGSGKCFYQEVRKTVAEADLVVMNHTLFFTLLASQPELVEKGTGTLFPNDFVIFDEAHTLESVAAKQLGLNITQAGLRFEWFHDEDGTRVGLNRPSNPNTPPFAGNVYSLSCGVNWKPTSDFVVRPEIRGDWYDGSAARQPFNDGNDDSQLMFGIDAVWLF